MSQGHGILLFVLIEAIERIEAAAHQALAAVNSGSLSNAEARRVLSACKPAIAVLTAAQTAAARVVAGTERHGDGGAQILADSAGLTRRDAHGQIKTAEVLQAAPVVRDAVASGRVSQANARRLAEVISKSEAKQVESDDSLLQQAESMRPEVFAREARRWTADRQRDGGEGEFRRLRARRSVRIFDGDDGMVHLRGELDPVTGRRIANRLNIEARRLHSSDQTSSASRSGEKRSRPQCLADALDYLTAGSGADGANGAAKVQADICVTAHVDEESGRLIGELPDGSRLPKSVLDELTCNAVITGVVFDRKGKAIWRTTAGRDATATQRRILHAKWGGCFHCGANFAICQPHHINPVSQGGLTHIDNLVPACWECHTLIHRHDWQIVKRLDGNHTLHPPDRTHYGPAHAPDHPPPVIATQRLLDVPRRLPVTESDSRPLPASAFGAARSLAQFDWTATPAAAGTSHESGSEHSSCGPKRVRATLRKAKAAQAARDGPG